MTMIDIENYKNKKNRQIKSVYTLLIKVRLNIKSLAPKNPNSQFLLICMIRRHCRKVHEDQVKNFIIDIICPLGPGISNLHIDQVEGDGKTPISPIPIATIRQKVDCGSVRGLGSHFIILATRLADQIRRSSSSTIKPGKEHQSHGPQHVTAPQQQNSRTAEQQL